MTSLAEENNPDTEIQKKPNLRPKEIIEEKEDIATIMRKLREQDKIFLTKDKHMSLKEFAESLGLNVSRLNIELHRSTSIHSHVYFFNVELDRNAKEKGTLKWTLRKKVQDFLELQKNLNHEMKKEANMTKEQIPQLSSFYDFTKRYTKPEDFLEGAQNYLQKLITIPEIRSKSTIFYEFIEFSLLPLPNGPYKYKEGYLKKRGGGRFKHNKLGLYFSAIFRRWQKRWFILTEEGIIYLVDSESTRVREMLLFDQSFRIEYGQKATGSRDGINLVVPNRKLNLQAKDEFEAMIWISEIQKAAQACHYTKQNRFDSFAPERDQNNYCKWYVDAEGYYEELCAMLLNAKKEVFITDWWLTPELPLIRPVDDGESEYRVDKVLAKIANAGVRVYIIVYNEVKLLMYNASDHTKQALESLSPNITVLQHPSEPFFSWSHHEKMVVIDQAIGFMGGFDLCFGRYDVSSHPLVDPDYVEGKGQMFLGKDYANPRIIDFKEVIEHDKPLIDKKTTPRLPWHDAMMKLSGPVVQDMSRHFIQYWNHVEVDVYRKAREAPLPKHNLAPEPSGDIAGIKMENNSIKLRNAFKKIFTSKSMVKGKMKEKAGEFVHEKAKPNKDLSDKQDPPIESQSTVASLKNDDLQKTPKTDRKRSNEDADKPEEHHHPSGNPDSLTSLDDNLKKERDSSAKKVKPEEPKKSEEEEKREASGLRKFAQGMKDKLGTVTRFFGFNYPAGGLKVLPVPGAIPTKKEYYKAKGKSWFGGICSRRKHYTKDDSDSESDEDEQEDQKQVQKAANKIRFITRKHHHGNFTEEHKTKLTRKRIERLLFSPPEKLLEGTCSCQMLRSAARWSMGLNKDSDDGENSIENAYIHIIKNAKNFIYIENQFFMSSTAGKVLKNRVGEALVERIIRAHEKKEKFRVLIFLPLVHAFEGDITDSKAVVIRIQMHWQYVTISRGESSIYESLRSKGIKPEDYIQFYGLRTHARMPNGDPVTEQIYIHSKILIADDNILLIGSANINDRSLLGSRDSEIAVVVEDHKKMESIMNGSKVEVSELACTFRRRLLGEHLGMKDEDVVDPLEEGFMKKMNEMVETNTNIYREIFMCYPDDNMKTVKDVEEMAEKKNLEKYDELKEGIRGHAVWFPLQFLEEEKLAAQISSMEYYIPDETYV